MQPHTSSKAQPVPHADRIQTLDILRGVALLGILMMNIPAFAKQLAAVGQMAFTNYIMQTVFCTLFFFGYGLNYFAELQFYQLYFVVAAIWVIQLVVSSLWMKYFLFDSLEWLWRSLTYWQVQPVRRRRETVTVLVN